MSLGNKLQSFDPTKRVGSLFDEFKNFAFKGNVVDLAIGVIIGAAFSTIIKSLVDNIIMPFISLIVPGENGYKTLAWNIGEKVVDGKVSYKASIAFGQFFADVLNFVLVALILFIFIKKFLGLVLKEKKTAPPPPTKDQEILMEIRDLLKQGRQ